MIGGDLTHAETSHITPYGKAEVQWEVNDNVLDLTVAVPAGTTAFVDIVDHERVDLVVERIICRWRCNRTESCEII